jgi:hypothetical protein
MYLCICGYMYMYIEFVYLSIYLSIHLSIYFSVSTFLSPSRSLPHLPFCSFWELLSAEHGELHPGRQPAALCAY